MVQEITILLKHPHGLHIRPAMLLANVAQQFESKIELFYNDQKANAKSIYALVGLCVMPNAELRFVAEGKDAAEALRAIAKLIESNFEEDGNGN